MINIVYETNMENDIWATCVFFVVLEQLGPICSTSVTIEALQST